MDVIVIVDDEKPILMLLAELLQQPGREIVCASSMAECLRKIRDLDALHLALVDKNIGDDYGIDVIEHLKDRHPLAEVFMMTAHATLTSAIEALKVGASDYIVKPFRSLAVLNSKLAGAIHKARLAYEHKDLQARLATSEERYRRVFERTSDAMFVYEAHSKRIRDVNQAAIEQYGYPRDSLLSMHFDHLCVDESISIEESSNSLMHAWTHRKRHARKDGTEFPVEVSRGGFFVDGAAMMIECVRDITERQQAEQRRQDLEERLRQSQKMEAVGQLAGGIAHDFNNLLAVAMAHVDLLQIEGGLDEEQIWSLTETDQALRRAAALTQQLLTFSRRKVVRPSVVDLNQSVQDLTRLIKPLFDASIVLETQLDGDLMLVKMDPDHVGQILLNLAVNGRDAMASGGTFTIATRNVFISSLDPRHQDLKPGQYVCIEVRDTGCGMTPEVMERLFEPFFTTKPKGEGTGLGLAVIYGIVHQAGGTVEVHSEPNAGTTFSIYLPATTSKELSTQTEPLQRAVQVGRETVMLVEDEDAVRAVVRQTLLKNGYKVIEATNGAEALQMLAEASFEHSTGLPFDVLLTDVMMPLMDGRQLFERLREQRPDLRALFMSGFSQDIVDQAALQAEGCDFIQKPFHTGALLSRLRGVMDRHAGSAVHPP